MKPATWLSGAALAAVLVLAPKAQALTDKLTDAQAAEALEFGTANAGRIEAVLADLYGCCGADRALVIRSKWCKLALVAGITAQQGRVPGASDRQQILQDKNLQIDITVYGPRIDFARAYRAHILQNGTTVQPDMLHADHFQSDKSAPAAGHAFSPWYAIIRAYFPYAGLRLDRPFQLVLVTQRGNRTFDVDPRRYK